MSALEKKIAALVELGVNGVREASIPPSVAQECARRWLVEQARDLERARARQVEEAAVRERYANEKRLQELRAEARQWLKARPEWHEFEPYDRQLFYADHVAGADPETALARLASRRASFREIDGQARHDLFGELDTIIRDGVDRLIERRAEEVGIEWTAALLTTTVALPDGSRVEWGEATREQHAARLDMLAKHAAGELETAARHRAAIGAIDAAGVQCLNELAAVPA